MKTTLGLRSKFSPTILALLTGVGGIFAVSQASALTIVFEDAATGGTLKISDNGPGGGSGSGSGTDLNIATGIVSYIGALNQAAGATKDTNWSLDFTVGKNSDGAFLLNLASTSVSAAAGGTLSVSVYDTTVSAAPAFIGAFSSTLTPGATADVTFSQYAAGDAPTGTAIEQATVGTIDQIAGAGTTTLLNGDPGNTTDFGIEVVLTHPAHNDTETYTSNFSATLQPVPIPGAAILFGSALFGTVFVGRRKKVPGKGA